MEFFLFLAWVKPRNRRFHARDHRVGYGKVSGILVLEQVEGGAPIFEECRRRYTQEINAAVCGAKAAGATEIVVVDCHGARAKVGI